MLLGVSVFAGALMAIITTVLFLLNAINDDPKLTRFCSNKFSSESELGIYEKAAVSSFGPECSKIGIEMLKKNGSAVDAAIATLLCEGIASLHSMGLGGGFFMTIWDSNNGGEATFLDARETAPSDASKNMFNGIADAAAYGGKAVAVPGELLGYWEAHKRYGKLKWSELFVPAIKLCEEGSIVTNRVADALKNKISLIRAEPSLAEILIDPKTNFTWTIGDKIKRPALRNTLQILSTEKDPINLFYNGTMGQGLIDEIQKFGGIMRMKDLQNYSVKWRKPITSKIGKLTMYTTPPPGSGVLLSFMMNLLRDLVYVTDENVFWQRIVESFKWAYARRTELADPDFEDIDGLVANLTSQSYADEIRKMIMDDQTWNDPEHYGAKTLPIEDYGTLDVSVIAPDGSAVSVTSTINLHFGAMIRSKSTGIIFNDEMDDFGSPDITNEFNVPPSPANFIKPGKRPLSSMAPTIIVDENNEVRLVIGGAGGTKITTAIAATMILNLWSGCNVKEAIDTPRIHHQLLPMEIRYEENFNETILSHLTSIGHKALFITGRRSAVSAIARTDGLITANSDYRSEGTVSGF